MKKLLLLLVLMMLPLVASADAVKINGIYYNLINEGNIAEVTSNPNKYTGSNIVIPESVNYNNVTYSVTSIGDFAFRDCFDLRSVTIPNSVTSIGNYAFYNCVGLRSVTIPPNSVKSIGTSAFNNCYYLTSITIPNSVTSIGDYAFCNCPKLTTVTINSNAVVSQNYSSSSSLKQFFGNQVQEYIIGNEVKSIGNSAFYDCSDLISITIPNSVTSIGMGAFSFCTGLTSITIPNSVTSIGDYAFWGCSGLTSITIPNSVTSIGYDAFRGCSGLTSITIPNSVTSIGSSAFYNCSSLTSVTIPNSVKSIGRSAFAGCSSLTSVIIGNNVTSIGEYAFYNCSNLTSITIPNSVTSIGNSAFYDCTGLKKVIVPDIVAWCRIKFGDQTANPLHNAHHLYSDENTKITDLIIPNNMTSIGDYAFSGCSGLTTITIPNSMSSIGNYSFENCSGLTTITIPNSMTSIGASAFSGCSGLTSVKVYAKTPPTAGSSAFPTNQAITLYVPRGIKAAYETANVWKDFGSIVEFGIAVTANDLTMVYGDALPELTYKVEGGSVTGTPQITCKATSTSPVGTYSIVISKGTIDSDEVNYVNGTLTIKKAPLTITAKSYTIEQGEGLPTFEVEYSGFKNNETSSVLTTQPTITTSATSESALGTYDIVVSGAYAQNYDITYVKGTLTITPSAESVTVTAKSYSRMYGEVNPTFEYSTAGATLNGTPSITCDATATSPIGEYDIVVSKGTVTNKYVTYENGKLTITKAPLTIIAKSYTIRYGSAMPTFEADYDGFKNNETSSVLTTQPTIRTTATSASVPGTYEIVVSGAEATNYDITYVNGTLTIEGGINGIFYEFNGDKAIVVASPYKYQGNVVIPASVNYNGKEYSVSSIGSKAFYDCSDLISITIPNSLTSIGDGAFNGCSGLTQVTINSNAIVSKAYSTSSSLNQIFGSQVQEYVIGDEVQSIGEYTFSGCSGITFITIPNSVTNIGNSAFYGCSGLKSVTLNSNAVVSKSYSSDINMKSIFGDQVTEYIIGDDVTSIGDYAFSGCSNLASFTIPNSVATIGVATFQGCSSLTSITIPYSVTSVGNSAFSGCSSLISVIFHCKEIGSWFSGLTSIKKIVIGDEVTNIGNNALSNCTGLTNITIPNNVKSIGNSAFYGCSGLLTVTIGNGITTLPSGVFYTGKKLMSLTIGSEVLSISQFAFQPLDPWTSDYNPIKTIWMANTPPKGYSYAEGTVNYVSNNLYSDLDSVTVYSSLSTIFEIDGVKYVPVSPSERTCEAIDCTYDESVEKINIGETVSYKGVEMTVKGVQHYTCYNNTYVTNADLSFEGYLGDHAFQNCTTMTTVMLGHKIPSIGSYAFEGCKALTGIVIPNEVTSLGGYAFQNCSSMASVKMGTGLTKINPHTFSNCSSLTDMQIGNKVETIDVYAFSGCSILPTIMIPQSVTDIQDFAFSGCTSLTNVNMEERMSDEMVLTLGSNDNHPLFADCPLDEVYIGRNISYSTESDKGYSPFYLNKSLRKVTITDRETEISINEFYKCKNLQDVTIGDGVESFGERAFSGCSSLKNFSFGMNVETIGREAFSDCTSMESIFSRSPEPPVCGEQALADINKWECKLTVPAGNKAAYQAADQWKDFFYIEEGEAVKKYFDISINVNEGGKVLVNNKEETKVSLKKGSEVVLQFIPNKDCSLKQVIVDGEDVTNQVVDGRYTLKEMPAHDVIITVSFTIAAVPEITADNKSRAYGEENPELTYTTTATLTGVPQLTTTATKTSPVGEYDIVVERGTVQGDYTSKNGKLTITKAPLKITAKSYSIKQGDALPTFEATYEGFKNNETNSVLTTQPTIRTTATSASAPGTYEIVVSGASATNYDISYEKGTLTITAAEAVTVTAKSYSRKYGEANPTFEYTTSGATLIGTPEITCEATATSPVGEYAIVVSKGSITNYNVTLENGKLTITKAPLTITAKSYSIKQGESLPTFEAEYAGFKNNETNSVLTTQPTIRTTATSASEPGTYEITISGASATNYDIEYVKGTLTISAVEVEPVTETETTTFSEDVNENTDLSNTIIDNTYYTMNAENGDGYDATEQAIVLNSTTTAEQMNAIQNAQVGDATMQENYNGIIFEVPAGSGTITVEVKTIGSHVLNVQIGNGAPNKITKSERGTADVPYNVTGPTYVYLYASTSGASGAPQRAAAANSLLLYSYKVDVLVNGISVVTYGDMENAKWYTTDGLQLQGKPTKKGLYIVNGRKVVVK